MKTKLFKKDGSNGGDPVARLTTRLYNYLTENNFHIEWSNYNEMYEILKDFYNKTQLESYDDERIRDE